MYDRRVNGQELNFGVSGLLWNRSLVMYDEETQSLWSHLLGECKRGVLEGSNLDPIPSVITPWKSWRELHPETSLLALSRTALVFNEQVYRNYDLYVLGWTVGGQAYHASFRDLYQRRVWQLNLEGHPLLLTYDVDSATPRLFSLRIGDRQFSFAADESAQMQDRLTASVWDPRTGECRSGEHAGDRLPLQLGIVSATQAWEIFHPDSRDVAHFQVEPPR